MSSNQFSYKGLVTRNVYKVRIKKEELEERFRISLAQVIPYIFAPLRNKRRAYNPNENQLECATAWISLINDVFKSFFQYENIIPTVNPTTLFNNYSIEDIYSNYKLPKYIYTSNLYNESTEAWGKRTWEFLHTLSVIVYNEIKLLEKFAYLVANLQIFTVCVVCRLEYFQIEPIGNVALKMILSRDPIYTLYELHNEINQQLGKDVYPFELFKSEYHLEVLENNTCKVDQNLDVAKLP